MARSVAENASSDAPERKTATSAEQLLNATCALLSERSSLDVSLSDIAKKSGLNSALIKYYFGNKEGLLLAVLERDAETAMEGLRHLVAMDLPAEKKLRVHISGLINAYYRSPYLNRLIHYMIENGEGLSSDRVAEIFVRPMVDAYREILDQGEREGSFRRIDPEFLYFSLVGSCDHLFHATYSRRSILGGPKLSDELRQRYAQHIIDTCLHGIAARG